MIRSAITISLIPETRSGPFVYQSGLKHGCARAKALGFDAVELFLPSADALRPNELRALLKQHQLQVAAFGTGAGWLLHRWSLTNPDAAIRAQACTFIASIIDFAAAFNASTIIGSMQGRVADDVTRAQAEQWLAEGLRELGARAAKHGVPLLYEPLNRYETNLFNRAQPAAAFLKRRKIRGVKLLCDLFHMNLEEASIPDTIRHLGPQLGHIHFVDTNRLAVGLGHLDVAPIIAALREIDYNGYLSAEVLALPNPDAAARQTMRAFRKFVHPD